MVRDAIFQRGATLSDSLTRFGWDPEWETEFEQHRAAGLLPARVAVEHRSAYVLYANEGEIRAELAGRLRHEDTWPTVGDWVGVRAPATIAAVLPRRTVFSRKEPWLAAKEQVLAANADTVLVTTALTAVDFKPRRLERYLATAWESGAQPAIVLTKPDLCDDLEAAVLDVESIAFGVPVHVVNGLTGDGIDDLGAYVEGNRTVALLGSSGVGKSTIVNRLGGGELMPTGEIGEDGRGRHTTRHRELILLPAGGIVLDTPGLRELQLWDVGEGLETTFEDVASFAARCRFTDCAHRGEPGCAVREALRTGALARERFDSWNKLQRELARLERRLDARARSEYRHQLRKEERQRQRTQRPPRRAR
jgi:ribosome biogenesis GTPase / thiamine phosphate phosphatase